MDHVKIGDFGISKILSSKSKALTVVGTPSYISPGMVRIETWIYKTESQSILDPMFNKTLYLGYVCNIKPGVLVTRVLLCIINLGLCL